MKIAVTSLGETLESPMDQRFGRARYFVLFDTASEKWSAHANTQNLTALQGAGIQAAQTVANLEVDAVLTGHCGPNAFATLTAAGIDVYSASGSTVSAAISEFRSGRLAKAGEADVSAHSGGV